jgi:hypothetical protein
MSTDYEARRRAKLAADPEYAARRRTQRAAYRNTPKEAARKLERATERRSHIGATYVTGKPCSRGHIAPRYAGNQTCVECAKEDRVHAEEKRQARMLTDVTFAAHRREQRNESNSGYRKRNRDKKSAEWAKYRADKLQRTPKWADLGAIREIYRKAVQATKLTGFQYHVDHILPLNGKRVSGLHIAENLRVVTEFENLSKGSKFMT